MQTIHLLIAVAPLALYLVLVGMLNLRRKPYLMTGAREAMFVGLALSGLMLIGPMELFFPQQAANQFGSYIWVMLLVFYLLVVMLWILISRPRLVVYNISPAQLRALLAEAAGKLDPEMRWAGDSLALPRLNVQLFVDGFDMMRNVSLIGTGGEQNYTNWRRLEGALREVLQEITVPRNPRGYSMFVVGILLLLILGFQVAQDPQAVAQGLIQLLRL
jgi:hypothetical protein